MIRMTKELLSWGRRLLRDEIRFPALVDWQTISKVRMSCVLIRKWHHC